jgi:hypothetical protein
LLDLFLPLGQLGHKGHVKVFLDHPSLFDYAANLPLQHSNARCEWSHLRLGEPKL